MIHKEIIEDSKKPAAAQKCKYSVCSVIFGVDDSILSLPLSDGFVFTRRSLNPTIDNLHQVFDTTIMGLRRDYETARVFPRPSMDVICAEKSIQTNLTCMESQHWFDTQTNKDLESLDNQIRVIRLYSNCHIRFKKVSFHLYSTECNSIDRTAITPVKEPAGAQKTTLFHCNSNEISSTQNAISTIQFPLPEKSVNTAHLLFDLSFHLENRFALLLLVIALESIFIQNDKGKKECLSKRVAVFLFDDRAARLNCYKNIGKAYFLRNKFVHEGLYDEIDDEIVAYTRKCVRDVVLSIDVNTYDKSLFIKTLKEKVTSINYWES